MNIDTEKARFETLALHGGWSPDPATTAQAVPIYMTAGYEFRSPEAAADIFALKQRGLNYSRIQNPTIDAFEKRMALLEGGVAAVATASGQTATMYALLNIMRQGDNVVSSSSLYGGVHGLLKYPMGKMGFHVKFVDPHDLCAWKSAIDDRTRAFYAESLGNPKVDTPDIAAIADLAHENGIPLVIDNTVPSPFLCRPFEHGADIVVHSTTKYIGGHGIAIGGVVVDKGDFNWSNGKFPEFTDADPVTHGYRIHRQFSRMAYAQKLRTHWLRDTGGCMSPFNAWAFLIGLETLPLRMERCSQNALELARWLSSHPKISWVCYPGLEDHPTHKNAVRYLRGGFSGMMGIGIKGGMDAAINFIKRVNVFTHVANLGDSKSLVIHPASTTHSPLEPEERAEAGITDDFVRVSVGIEHIDDLKEDLDQALSSQ